MFYRLFVCFASFFAGISCLHSSVDMTNKDKVPRLRFQDDITHAQNDITHTQNDIIYAQDDIMECWNDYFD